MTTLTDPSIQESEAKRFLGRDAQEADSSALASKVLEDIRFLRDRIDRIKKLHNPNSTVLKTYESMLASREAVIAWLRDNGKLDGLSTGEALNSAAG